MIQSLIIVGLALLVRRIVPQRRRRGARVLIVQATILGAALRRRCRTAWRCSIRREETLIAAMQFLLLPLTFLSGGVHAARAWCPAGSATSRDFNPVNWAVESGRSSAMGNTDWGFVAERMGFLLAFLAVALAFTIRAFRTYQRSV